MRVESSDITRISKCSRIVFLSGWWISEKLDGVRAYWDGKTFYSRLGNEFIPPSWFIKDFPKDMTLDGELFGGRGKFQKTVSIVKTPGSGRWKDIQYYIFDAPSVKKPFEERITRGADGTLAAVLWQLPEEGELDEAATDPMLTATYTPRR